MAELKNPRAFMHRAVAVMEQSIAEPRADGQASPSVGAVLVREGKTVGEACRGELRQGDHAEFTLLERKNRDTKLDGTALFCTLEPCAPGARHEPKLSCAERIVLARIAQVWVGIEDPDPKVDRKGIKFLQDNGVQVRMFDRDYQEQIRAANQQFIDEAEERAATAKDRTRTKPIVLSELESTLAHTSVRDFQLEVLESYRATGNAEVDDEELNRRLLAQGLVEDRGGELVPTGNGMILFGAEPRLRIPHAGLMGTIHFPDGREETRDFDGPAVLTPRLAIEWLQNKLPDPIDRSQVERKTVNSVLFELTREAIVNALVHRDYGIEGAKCQLVASQASIEVQSPGLPIEPVTLEQLKSFDAPMLSRNPVLHYVFARMGLAEERGLGLKSMRLRAAEAGLPLPEYTYRAPYVVLSLYRVASAALPFAVSEKLSESERAGWAWLVTRDTVTTAEYERAMKIPNRTAKNHMKKMTDIGLLERVGKGRATRYVVIRS